MSLFIASFCIKVHVVRDFDNGKIMVNIHSALDFQHMLGCIWQLRPRSLPNLSTAPDVDAN